MNELRIDEDSEHGNFLQVGEPEPLEGADRTAVFIRTDGYQQGPTVILYREQVMELRNWLNEFLYND